MSLSLGSGLVDHPVSGPIRALVVVRVLLVARHLVHHPELVELGGGAAHGEHAERFGLGAGVTEVTLHSGGRHGVVTAVYGSCVGTLRKERGEFSQNKHTNMLK